MEKGAVNEHQDEVGHYISDIFLRKKPSGEFRLILNLKGLNKFIEKNHFKLEDFKTAIKLVKKHCFMASIDLKDAYYLIPVPLSHRKYI